VVAVLLLAVAPAGLTVAVTTTPTVLTALPLASSSCTTGCGANGTPLCAVPEGGVVSTSCVAAPAVTVTGAVCVIATVLIVAAIVFAPVLVELNVAVSTPLALVVPVAGVKVFPVPPVAVRFTLAPPTGFPLASRAVTVIVDEPPAGIDVGAAVTVDWDADTVPAVTVTGAVCVIATVLIVAAIDFAPVLVELNVAVMTPVASVVPVAGVRVFPVPPVAVRFTLAPPITLPLASRAVTVIVDEPPAGIEVGAAATVDCDADTAPAPSAIAPDVAGVSVPLSKLSV